MQIYGYTKSYIIVHFKWVNCESYLNKTVRNTKHKTNNERNL